jgi:hypothetical protein
MLDTFTIIFSTPRYRTFYTASNAGSPKIILQALSLL